MWRMALSDRGQRLLLNAAGADLLTAVLSFLLEVCARSVRRAGVPEVGSMAASPRSAPCKASRQHALLREQVLYLCIHRRDGRPGKKELSNVGEEICFKVRCTASIVRSVR